MKAYFRSEYKMAERAASFYHALDRLHRSSDAAAWHPHGAGAGLSRPDATPPPPGKRVVRRSSQD